MKAATAAAKTLVKNGHAVRAVPKVRAEWEHNRFSPINKIEVQPPQTPDEDWAMIYDLDSIGLPNRPRNGVAKLRFDSNGKAMAKSEYNNILPAFPRFYLPTEVDPYRYFSSTQRCTIAKGWDEGYDFAQPIQIDLMYENTVVTNKIVVGFETSYAKPKTFTIETTTNGVAWVTAASTPTIDSRGLVTLWRNDNGQWTGTPDYDSPTRILGIRLTIYSMDLPYTHADVIQMGARLENDLSEFVEDYSRSFEISDRSLIAPLGRASSNEASLSLNNMDRRFNNENEDSLYYGLIGKKVKITCDLSLDVTPTGSADERIREFTMYSENWGGQDEVSVNISLKDSSVFLQEKMVPKVFWENLTVGAIIWQLMDILGMTNYQYTKTAADTGQRVPYFWSDGETTAWETISKLAEGTQTAVYFDEYDVMQIRTRRAMFGESKDVDWNFDAITNGQKLADIVSMSTEDELVVNKVEVKYKPAKYSDFNNGLPKMETVWEPDQEDVVLRSSPLVKDLLNTHMEMWISQTQTIVWPYEATVNIRGELLRYKGKEYVWRKPGGSLGYEWVYSLEDKQRIDAASDANMAWANAFSGKLKIAERGLNGTNSDNHYMRPASYTTLITNYENTKLYPLGVGQGMNYFDGTMTLATPVNVANDHEIFLAKHEAVVPSDDTTYGMRFRFPQQQIRGDGGAIGGIWFAGDALDAGYFLEITPTLTIDNIEGRRWRHELCLTSMPSNTPIQYITSRFEGNTKGWKSEIVKDVWYDLDVRHKVLPDGRGFVNVFLNGVWAGDWTIPVNQKPTSQGKFGVFTRGMAKIELEHLYAVHQENSPEPDESTFFDLKNGGFASGYIDRQWRYGKQYWTVNRGPAQQGSNWFEALNNRADYVLDEYGPVVHELREFEVTFDEEKVPVSHSYLYVSNESQVYCTNYWADPFGAKFTLVNAARQHATVKGEDRLTFGQDNPIQHQFFLYGRALYQEDEMTRTEEDKQSIRRNGPVDLTFDNDYIQTEDAAKDLGAWVVEQWAAGSDEIKLTVFGNPFIQIGDLVTVNYPLKDMLPTTHKYYIVSLRNSFSSGLETELILRRARI